MLTLAKFRASGMFRIFETCSICLVCVCVCVCVCVYMYVCVCVCVILSISKLIELCTLTIYWMILLIIDLDILVRSQEAI